MKNWCLREILKLEKWYKKNNGEKLFVSRKNATIKSSEFFSKFAQINVLQPKNWLLPLWSIIASQRKSEDQAF